MAEILVELPGGAGVIRGDDGAIEFTHDVRELRGQPLQPGRPYEPVIRRALSGRWRSPPRSGER